MSEINSQSIIFTGHIFLLGTQVPTIFVIKIRILVKN